MTPIHTGFQIEEPVNKSDERGCLYLLLPIWRYDSRQNTVREIKGLRLQSQVRHQIKTSQLLRSHKQRQIRHCDPVARLLPGRARNECAGAVNLPAAEPRGAVHSTALARGGWETGIWELATDVRYFRAKDEHWCSCDREGIQKQNHTCKLRFCCAIFVLFLWF